MSCVYTAQVTKVTSPVLLHVVSLSTISDYDSEPRYSMMSWTLESAIYSRVRRQEARAAANMVLRPAKLLLPLSYAADGLFGAWVVRCEVI